MSGVALYMVSVMVPDMDDAIAHFTQDWGFALATDGHHISGHRWVEVSPGEGAKLRLVAAQDNTQHAVVGRQVADRVAFFIKVSDFDETVSRWSDNGIEIVEPVRIESYGKLIVLKDKYGNRWDAFDAAFVADL